VQSLVRRTKEKGIAGDWEAPAAKLWTDKVQPALDRQIALAESLRAKAVHDAGVWRLPDGPDYYRASLLFWTTSRRTPEDIHQVGLDLVEKLSARMDELMKAQGLTQGTVGQRLRAMYQDPRFRYPNTDEGKEKLIADLNVKVRQVQAKLPQWFGTLPKASVEIKRVPKYIEAGAPGGYYQNGSLDGKRPGAYYINLRDTAEVPSWTLPTLTYHESIPGHHLQISLQQEADLPMIRRLSFFSSYIEGWALYAEQLGDELGMYADDPFGRLGYLQSIQFRACRLAVDTGLHAKRWTRKQAIDWLVENNGSPEDAARGEIDRYCAWPGQACGYQVGHLHIDGLRTKAKAALGPRFDLKGFNDAVLASGSVPLTLLDGVVDRYVQRGLAA
jgi:uncharacterized protein (DUF885 family)